MALPRGQRLAGGLSPLGQEICVGPSRSFYGWRITATACATSGAALDCSRSFSAFCGLCATLGWGRPGLWSPGPFPNRTFSRDFCRVFSASGLESEVGFVRGSINRGDVVEEPIPMRKGDCGLSLKSASARGSSRAKRPHGVLLASGYPPLLSLHRCGVTATGAFGSIAHGSPGGSALRTGRLLFQLA